MGSENSGCGFFGSLVGRENSAAVSVQISLISFPKLFTMDGVESPFETSNISDHESMLNGNSSDTDVEWDGTPRRR